MVDPTPQSGTASTTLSELRKRYSHSTSPRTDTYESFDRNLEHRVSDRISKSPSAYESDKNEIVTLFKTKKQIQLDLARYLTKYGKLNLSFRNTLGKDGIFKFGDSAKIVFYSVFNSNKADEIRVEAAGRKGESIVTLVDYMAETLTELYETAKKDRDLAQRVQTDTVSHMKLMDRTLIDRLTNSYVGGSDLEEASSELKKLDAELKDFDKVTDDYEVKILNAKASSDTDEVKRLTAEVTEVLQMKEEVLDGKRSAEGVVSDIRRKILSSAEGINSAKNATAATKVAYANNSLWIDATHQMVSKYEHALHDFIPVYKIQGQQSAGIERGLNSQDALIESAAIMERLMKSNAQMTQVLARNAFELTKRDLIDRKAAAKMHEEIKQVAETLSKEQKEWAEAQQRISEDPLQSHYTNHS